MNDLTLLMDLKFSTDIPEDLMRIASDWGSAGDPNDIVYIVLEEEPIGSNPSTIQEPQNITSQHIPVKYRCQQCFLEFDNMKQLECHVACCLSAGCLEWTGKIDKLGETDVQFNDLQEQNILNNELLSCETFQSILDNFDKDEDSQINLDPQKELEPPLNHHSTGEKSYECKHCGKTFSRGFLLREHLKDAVKQNPFICEQCGVCFSNRESLKNHLPVHSEETFYTCNDCGKTFRQRGYLKSHVRTHTGEKPFNCQVCGKSFTQKSNLNIHLKGHTGGKPHSCKYCGECFAYKMMLNSHLKSHI